MTHGMTRGATPAGMRGPAGRRTGLVRLAVLLGLGLSLSGCISEYGIYTPLDLFNEPYHGYDPGPTHRDR